MVHHKPDLCLYVGVCIMATHTVYGCYIASTGQFEFNDTVCAEATITGCLVKEGDHAGQIEITHDYDGCETQYYACYDPATGKFKFEADDGCCECESGCEICEIPNEVDVTFIDVQQCPESEEPNLNGTWRLVLTDIEEDICRWRYTSGDVMITFYVTATTSGLTAITKTDYPSTVCFFDAPSLVCQFSFVNDYQTDNYCWYGGAGAQSCYGGTAEISW